MLPIVQRELLVAARGPKLYARRVGMGVVQAAVILFAVLISSGGFRTSAAESYFQTFSRLALLFCLLEGVRKSSDAISAEKREGTLGFLFLSTLSGADVVLGKLAGGLTRSLSVLLPFIPILAFNLILGGTTLGEFWRVVLVLVTVLIASLGLCLLVSTISRQRSVIASIGILAALCLFPELPPFRGPIVNRVSPFDLLASASDLLYHRNPASFWFGVAMQWGICLLSILLASIIAPRSWQEQKVAHTKIGRVDLRKRKRRFLEVNPVLWLTYDSRGQIWFQGIAIILAAAGLIPLIALNLQVADSEFWMVFPSLAAGVLFLIIWLRIAVQTSTNLAAAKSDGSLEMLLATPLSIEEVVRGFWLAVWHSLRIPAVCVFLLMVAAFIASGGHSIGQAIWSGKVTIELLFQGAVLAAVGMWMGLKAKTRAAAVVYTILVGGILPWVVCVFTILVQIVLFLRALDQVKSILRQIRNGGINPLLPPIHSRRYVQPGVPPVIR